MSMLISIVIFLLFFLIIPSVWMKLFIQIPMNRNDKLQMLAICLLSCSMGTLILSGPKEFKKPENALTYEQFKARSQKRIKWWVEKLEGRRLHKMSNEDIKEKCQTLIHEDALSVLEIGEMEEISEIEHLCLFRDGDDYLEELISLSVFDKFLLVAHGTQDSSGKDTFAEGLLYDTFRKLAKEEGKEIAILSCRGSESNNDLWFEYKFKTFELEKAKQLVIRSTLPHLENGLWVYGQSGYLTDSALKLQYRGWKQQMSTIGGLK
jgi:hypothetical protein